MDKSAFFSFGFKPVEVDGQTFYVRPMSTACAIAVNLLQQQEDIPEDVRNMRTAHLALRDCIVTDDGDRVFDDSDQALAEVAQIPTPLAMRLSDAALEVSGFGGDDEGE